MRETTVTNIHHYPLRPTGFAEPLFLGRSAKKEVAEHLACSGWLEKASEVLASGEARLGEPCHVYRGTGGAVWLARPGCRRRRRRAGKRRVARVLERWREVRGWWEPGSGANRLCFRVLLEGGAVVDLAVDRSGSNAGAWFLVRVLD